MERKNVPEIRFEGFDDDWEQCKIEDIAEIVSGGTPDTNNPSYWDGDINWYAPAEIVDQIYVSKSERKITELGLQKSSAKMLPANRTILFTSRAGIGKVAILQNSACTNQGFQSLVLKNEIDPYFVYSMGNQLKEKAEAVASGSTFLEISGKMLANLDIMMPNKDEQEKIATHFKSIDKLIIFHQRKYENLKLFKEAMLDKMFPKNGEKVPEIRFKGFTSDWEQRKFRELYKKSSEKNDGSIGMDKNITVATMQYKEDVKVSTDDYLKTYYIFKLGDIAFEGHQSKEFRFGRFVKNDIGDGIVSHIFAVFRPIVDYDLNFWKYAINHEGLMQRVLSRSTKASTMMHDLVTNDFLNEEFRVPKLEEQKKIGQYFSHFDRLITLYQHKYEKLKLFKEAMFNKMFI